MRWCMDSVLAPTCCVILLQLIILVQIANNGADDHWTLWTVIMKAACVYSDHTRERSHWEVTSTCCCLLLLQRPELPLSRYFEGNFPRRSFAKYLWLLTVSYRSLTLSQNCFTAWYNCARSEHLSCMASQPHIDNVQHRRQIDKLEFPVRNVHVLPSRDWSGCLNQVSPPGLVPRCHQICSHDNR